MDTYTAISVCTGVGMLDHGVNLAIGGGLSPMLYVEREAFCCANLVWQMEKGFLAEAPIWDDVKTLVSVTLAIARPVWNRPIDLFIGGIPCQPWSVAGKQAGDDDERDLWPASLEAIKKFKPSLVFIENVAGIVSKQAGAWRIKSDLEGLGYRVEAGVFSSEEAGAYHLRQRVFIMAHSTRGGECGSQGEGGERGRVCEAGGELAHGDCSEGSGQSQEKPAVGSRRSSDCDCELGDAFQSRLEGHERDVNGASGRSPDRPTSETGPPLPRYAPGRNDFVGWAVVAGMDPSLMPAIERELCRVVNGMASRIDRLRAIGNGVDPLVAAYAFVTLYACITE